MSTTSTSLSSYQDKQTANPSKKALVSPSYPFAKIFHKYYAIAEDDREAFNIIIQPGHTTKASILSHAVGEETITYTDYFNHTFSTLVEFNYPSINLHAALLPIIMCINEGSTEEFKNELEGILADYLGVKVAEFKIWSLIIGGSEDDSSPVDPFKETHILFERLIDTVRPV